MLQLSDSDSRVKREVAASLDAAVRTRSVRVDLGLDLPPRIALADGEEVPYARRMRLRHPEQELELVGKCVRPPPNRTVFEGESPPPYRAKPAPNNLSHARAESLPRCHCPAERSNRGPLVCKGRSEQSQDSTASHGPLVCKGRTEQSQDSTASHGPLVCKGRTEQSQDSTANEGRLSEFGSVAGLAHLTMVPCHSQAEHV